MDHITKKDLRSTPGSYNRAAISRLARNDLVMIDDNGYDLRHQVRHIVDSLGVSADAVDRQLGKYPASAIAQTLQPLSNRGRHNAVAAFMAPDGRPKVLKISKTVNPELISAIWSVLRAQGSTRDMFQDRIVDVEFSHYGNTVKVTFPDGDVALHKNDVVAALDDIVLNPPKYMGRGAGGRYLVLLPPDGMPGKSAYQEGHYKELSGFLNSGGVRIVPQTDFFRAKIDGTMKNLEIQDWCMGRPLSQLTDKELRAHPELRTRLKWLLLRLADCLNVTGILPDLHGDIEHTENIYYNYDGRLHLFDTNVPLVIPRALMQQYFKQKKLILQCHTYDDTLEWQITPGVREDVIATDSFYARRWDELESIVASFGRLNTRLNHLVGSATFGKPALKQKPRPKPTVEIQRRYIAKLGCHLTRPLDPLETIYLRHVYDFFRRRALVAQLSASEILAHLNSERVAMRLPMQTLFSLLYEVLFGEQSGPKIHTLLSKIPPQEITHHLYQALNLHTPIEPYTLGNGVDQAPPIA